MAAASKVRLTDRYLQTVKPAPAGKRLAIWDAVIPNFGIRVTDRGRVSFVTLHTDKWTTLGTYPAMTLAEAREATRKPPDRSPTVAKVAELFIARHVTRLRTAERVERIIRGRVLPVLGHRPIGEVRRRDIIALVEDIEAQFGPEAARNLQATVSKMFAWAVSRDTEGLEVNPAAKIATLPPPTVRERVLTDPELAAVWRAAGDLGTTWGAFFRLLMLTGQRRGEVSAARWCEVDLDAATLTIPAERYKTNRTHVVHLAPVALSILRGLPRFDHGDYILTTTGGRRPIGNIAQTKARLVAMAGVAQFRNHDLRRTMRTRMSELGIPSHIAERVIGHGPSKSSIEAVYDRYSYDAEKADAMARWEARLMSIVEPPPANVVKLSTIAG